jgi:tetratricopeptide (TPR) repeat protein
LAYGGKGLAYLVNKDYDNSIVNYTKAIELDPDDASNYYFRSANYLIKGEKEKYYADLQKALDLGYKPTRLWHERSN